MALLQPFASPPKLGTGHVARISEAAEGEKRGGALAARPAISLAGSTKGEDDPAMSSLKIASMAVIACLVACGGQTANSSSAQDPSGVENESAEPEATESDMPESEAEESAETESETSASEASQSGDSEAKKSAESSEKDEPKPGCNGLPESRCKVTVGCAWSTDKICLAQ